MSVVRTALGNLEFVLVDDSGASPAVHHSIDVVCLDPVLTGGQVTESRTAVVLRIEPRNALESLRFECRWVESPGVAGELETGQYLESLAWRRDGRVVSVGTEDEDSLASRLPSCGYLEERWTLVHSTDDGLIVEIPSVPAGQMVSFHYIVAENPFPEPKPEARWYAVDVDHRSVIAALDATG